MLAVASWTSLLFGPSIRPASYVENKKRRELCAVHEREAVLRDSGIVETLAHLRSAVGEDVLDRHQLDT
jgi:hypothetical protein